MQLLYRAEHFLPRFFADVRVIVEYARNRADCHTAVKRYVFDVCHGVQSDPLSGFAAGGRGHERALSCHSFLRFFAGVRNKIRLLISVEKSGVKNEFHDRMDHI